MAKVTINLKEFMDTHVQPVVAEFVTPNPVPLLPPIEAGQAAYNIFIGAVGGVLDTDIEIDFPDLPGLPGLPAAPVAPQITPIDPAKALGDIAKAIRQAEQTLLGENLSIRNASVDVELTVAVAGAAGATAKFNLEIGPTPSD